MPFTNEEFDELYEERAGIREFDGGFLRKEAERLARRDVLELEQRKDQHEQQKD